MAHRPNFHERHREEGPVAPPSPRSFGLLFAGIAALVGGVKLWLGQGLWPWWFGVAAMLAAVALARPAWLEGPNRLWLRFGLLLYGITTPVSLAVVWLLAFTPMGLVLRLVRPSPLRLNKPTGESYWVPRQAARHGTMRNQF